MPVSFCLTGYYFLITMIKMIKCFSCFSLILTLINCGIVYAQINTILFRFNANHDSSQNVSSTVQAFNVTFSDEVDSIETDARGINGWDYYAPIRTIFSGNDSYLKSAEKVRVSFAGDHMLSGEVWFNPEVGEMAIFSWNDSTQTHGIDLYLIAGKIMLERRFYDTTIVLQSNSSLKLNEWHYINWTLSVDGQNVNMACYLDGILDINRQFVLSTPVGFAIVNSTVQIGKSDYNSSFPFFQGKLSAVNFKSYISQEAYLNAHIPFDGAEYFGIPAYHNYNLGTASSEADQRISVSSTPVMESVIVPYMDDDFIPQGLTNSYEDDDGYYEQPMVYSAMYNKTVEGITARKRSIIVEMDPNNNYKIRRCFQLSSALEYGHVGGIAFFGNRIYVASSAKIEVYSIPEFDSTQSNNKYVNLTTPSNMLFNVGSRASFVTYFRDSVWVGDYKTSGSAYLWGYPLNEDGTVDVSSSPNRYMMPLRTQGVAWTNVEGIDYLMISTSGGDGRSYIYRTPRANLSFNQVPIVDKTLEFPAGGEDLTFDKDKNLYGQSESGAKYFQKRISPWVTFYPFLFKISYDIIFDDITSVEENDSESKINQNNIILRSYPNPANGEIQIILKLDSNSESELKIVDMLGQVLKTWLHIQPGKREQQFTWADSSVASGIYFLQLITNGNIYSHKMILMK
jgi:hypothetical protein